MDNSQHSLFESSEASKKTAPLAHLSRPVTMSDFVGHESIFINYPFLKSKDFPSLILHGASGTGKTTLARLLALQSGKEFFTFNAVLGGVQDLKKLITSSQEMKKFSGKDSLIFIDEIHRFNKSQQDALLPYIEEGEFTLIGATTENPRTSVNKALLSRMHIVKLEELTKENIFLILKNTLEKFSLNLNEEHLQIIAMYASGDARVALNTLEAAAKIKNITTSEVKNLIIENARAYDRGGNRHYDVISAFIKSMRGSDPQAALLWLAVMLDGGEDPHFIARRLVIFASEDVGNADPTALTLATSALSAVSLVGMPEGRIILAQATTYLASTYKSNASYLAINMALQYVSENATIDVPDHLKNHPPHNAKKYLYPHDYESHWVNQQYSPNETPIFYHPTSEGREEGIKKRLEKISELKK